MSNSNIQAESIKSVQLPPDLHERIKVYAEDNQMSVSEAIREAIRVFSTGQTPTARKRRSRRVTFWVPPEMYLDFTKKAKKEGVTLASAIEVAMEELL